MSAADNKALIESMYAALADGNAEGFLGALADDMHWTIIGNTVFSKTYASKRQFIEELIEPFMQNMDGHAEITPHNLIAEGDFVAMQSRGRARTKTGRDYNNTYCHVFRVRDGKVAEVTEYLDTELVTAAFSG